MLGSKNKETRADERGPKADRWAIPSFVVSYAIAPTNASAVVLERQRMAVVCLSAMELVERRNQEVDLCR
jgi:hypothetical protein